MTVHCLTMIEPYDPIADARVQVRLASASVREITGAMEQRWEPAMQAAPATSIRLSDGDLHTAVDLASARLPVSLRAARRSHPAIDRYYWPKAPVTIWASKAAGLEPWPVHFAGRVSSFSRDKDVLALACEVDDEPLRIDLLTRSYAGTGAAEGGADLKDRPKPLLIGRALNAEPVLIDAVNSVYQFSGYGPIEDVEALFERASDFGDATANFASYAALVAAAIPPGRWATCLAEGMVRLGAPAFGVITGDVRGHAVAGATPRLTGAVIEALARIAAVDADLIDHAAMLALDAEVPFTINLVLDAQANFLDTARRLALCCNYQAGVGLTGGLYLTRIGIQEDASLELHAQGRRMPQVVDTKELGVSAPYARTILGANRAWRVQTTEEIAFDGPLIDKGAYDDAATYRYGNLVTQPDQSQWLYINDAPTSGNDPPAWPGTSNAWWSNTKPPVMAADVTFAGGETVEDLKPAEAAADVTSYILAPQGAFETIVQCDYTGAVKAGQVDPRYVQFRLMRNGVDRTEDATWSLPSSTGTWGGSLSNTAGTKGRLNVTSLTSNSILQIQAVLDGATRPATHQLTRQVDASPSSGSGGGSSASGSINATIVGNTMAAASDELTVTVGSGGNVQLSGDYTFTANNNSGVRDVYARWYKWNGSAYIAIGTEVICDASFVAAGFQEGYGGISLNDTGNTAGSSQKYRLYIRGSNSANSYYPSGSVSAVAS